MSAFHGLEFVFIPARETEDKERIWCVFERSSGFWFATNNIRTFIKIVISRRINEYVCAYIWKEQDRKKWENARKIIIRNIKIDVNAYKK